MPITIIKGPAKSGKSALGNALRNSHIGRSRPDEGVVMGALLVDDTNDGETKPLLEKLLLEVELPDKPPEDLSALPWKAEPLVILIGDKAEPTLKRFEKALPGFTNFFGPVRTLTTDVLPKGK